jgi:hypothetical protein
LLICRRFYKLRKRINLLENLLMIDKTKFNFSPIFIFLFLVFLINCNSVVKKETQKEIDFSGEELFAAIYFGYGTFSKNVLKFNSPTIKKDLQLKINQLTERVRTTDSLFFLKFKRNITSANHLLIQQEIQNGNDVLKKNKFIFYPKRKTNLGGKDPKDNLLLDANIVTNRFRGYQKKIKTLRTNLLIDKIAKYYENFI